MALVPHRKKVFSLTINPDRLSGIRNERRPGSRYASLENCRMEVRGGVDTPGGHSLAVDDHQSIEGNRHHHPPEIRPERLTY